MSSEADETLLDQAERALKSAAELDELLPLAMACHRRMLALGEGNLPEAVRHALAGASLFTAIQAVPSPLPEWLTPHEEQCCRYGAIWIHQLIHRGDQQALPWCSRALQLLTRMEQLQQKPIAWAAGMRMDLQRHLPSHRTAEALRMAVVGNCQSYPLLQGLQQALPQVDIHFCPPVHLATPSDVARLHSRLDSTNLLVAQRVQPGYRDNIGLDTATLRQLMPSGAHVVVLPNIHYEGCYPWLGYAQDPGGLLADLDAESPLGAYHDFLAMAAAQQGLAIEPMLDPAPTEELLNELRSVQQRSLNELRLREADCTLGLADWIEQQYQRLPLSHSFNHPTQAVLDQLLRLLLDELGLPHQLGAELFDAREHLGAISIPIHPWVCQALSLGSWSSAWGQRQGTPLSIEKQLSESLAFYGRHPWIAAANGGHPKMQLAQRCLRLMREPRRPGPSNACVEVLHLHGFKCAGSTFIWSLEHACDGAVGYFESPAVNQRLAWEHVEKHLHANASRPRAITSHLITLPPPGAVARLKVAFLRDPIARLESAYRFQRHVQNSIGEISFHDYVEQVCKGPLANYQTCHLSPQLKDDWTKSLGWAARPERIDLHRSDLFVGLVERYDDSIIALEYQLEQLGIPLDLSYPQAFNTTREHLKPPPCSQTILEFIEIDAHLYQRVNCRLDERLAAIVDLAPRRSDFLQRCRRLREDPPPVRIKPNRDWTFLSAQANC
jgi:hypothetical protein